MSLKSLGELNWLAVIGRALVYFALGALWNSPALFGRSQALGTVAQAPPGVVTPSPTTQMEPRPGPPSAARSARGRPDRPVRLGSGLPSCRRRT